MHEIQILGRVDSCYNEKWGTPRQGKYGSKSLATINLNTNVFTKDELQTLEEYSHAILIFIFNLNKIKHSPKNVSLFFTTDIYFFGQNAKVTPPKIDNGGKMGCLATRSPHRPNPIGLTVCNIVKVDLYNMKIQVGNIDIIDGTPIIEILPYSRQYSICANLISTPSWVRPDKNKESINLNVYFSLAAFLDVSAVSHENREKSNIHFFENGAPSMNFNKLIGFIVETLNIDPRSRYSKKKNDHRLFGIKLFNNFQLIYFHHEECIKVIRFLRIDNILIRGLNPRTSSWYNRISNFIAL
ncbi:hypothetical protein OJ253_2098 [Cryptosporidium canis]|uniref:TsaA-like domain-containing protein n=1 Tax=Cryptosporidium canis TaxID=195482 RepID=A0A9D5DFP7_9CRYT|nr:hypothetical protein OJ253_2098 [Cryptosporidium canis]